MTAEQKKLLRDAIVAALVTAAPLALPLPTLKQAAKAAGFKVGDDELAQHLHYLVGKELAVEKPVPLSAGVKRWEATAGAVEYAEAEGLV